MPAGSSLLLHCSSSRLNVASRAALRLVTARYASSLSRRRFSSLPATAAAYESSILSPSAEAALALQSAAAASSNNHQNNRPNLIQGLQNNNNKKQLNGVPVPTTNDATLINGNGANGSSLLDKQHQQDCSPYESDLVVVLDMDECLLHSKFFSQQSARYAFQVPNGHHSILEEDPLIPTDAFHITLSCGDFVRVHKRPFLQEFLQHCVNRYETHIFTAAMSIYAEPVLDRLEEKYDIELSNRHYRESCLLQDGMYVKDLSKVLNNRPLHKCVLVDNNPCSFLANPSNGILVQSFYQDPSDATLPAVIDLLRELESHSDVRPILKEKFQLEQTLKQHGL